jgi:NAD(P)-dependent dehydrogenase (short-subunit alcohol dehydrogenase family)
MITKDKSSSESNFSPLRQGPDVRPKKVALITGGSRGIGLGIAKHLAKAGFDIAINGVREELAVQDTLIELQGLGVEAIYCQGSVSSSSDRKKVIHQVKEQFGKLNVLVNNAGIAPRERRDVLETSEESFDEVVSTNLKGNYFLTQQVANWMIEQKKSDQNFNGCIINVSSISATVASVNRGEYCISKAGISMATQLFAVRLGEFNIPVFEVRPGIISTDMTAGVKEKYDTLIAGGLTVQNRWGYPDDVGKAVSALASGSFSFSTGQVIMVDGGLTIPRL